jgi:hypothetical protein
MLRWVIKSGQLKCTDPSGEQGGNVNPSKSFPDIFKKEKNEKFILKRY